MQKRKLIILPGWSGNDILWQHQLQYLKDIVDPEVLVITNQNTVEKMAEEVVARIPGKFILVGHSLGGLVAQHIAMKHPEKIYKLILMATWTGVSNPAFQDFIKQALKKIKNNESASLFDEVRPSLVHPTRINEDSLLSLIEVGQSQFPKEGLINQTLAEMDTIDTMPFLHKIQCPTLIIHARQDSFFSLETHEAIQNKIPYAEMTIIEGSGHMLSIEKPEAITALLRLWIQKIAERKEPLNALIGGI